MAKIIGKIALFNVEKDDTIINCPALKGTIETPKGKKEVVLWLETNDKVTGGHYYKGSVYNIEGKK